MSAGGGMDGLNPKVSLILMVAAVLFLMYVTK